MRKTKYILIVCAILVGGFVFAQRPSFNKNKDILIAQFDSKPDPDDIHAQAALGCMLAHPDLAGVEYYAVAGAVGHQGGQFIDSDNLFDMAFGSSNWTDADANWNASVTRVKNKVIPILQNGGKVWVQEAGQSDFTADWVAQVLQTVSQTTVKNNVVVVQHSEWNEDKTTSSDLSYIKNKTSYFAIDDGNAPFNASWGDRGPWSTPEYRKKQRTWMAQAKNSVNPVARQLWTEADNVIDTLWPNGYPHDWSFIHDGGVDYSDCAENWWIFNIGANADSTAKFWSRYVTNTPEPSGCNMVFEEINGVAAVEAEDFIDQTLVNDREWFVIGTGATTPTPDPDPSHAGSASDGKYIELLPDTRVTHGDPLVTGVNFSNTPGVAGVINYKVKFNSPGKYYVWVRAYSTGSEDNGVHVGIDGTWPESGKRMQWCSGKNAWTWESKQRTNANHCGEAQKIFLDVPSAGVHTISFSMREDGFEMDKFILSKAYTKPTGAGADPVAASCDGSVTGVSVSPASLLINITQTASLTETVSPANATDKSVTWSSSDTSIATVSSTGVVTGVAVGTATITVTTNDGDFTDTSIITVSSDGGISIGNPANTNALADGWKSNLVIIESDTYTNTSGASQTLNVDQFIFYANRKADPITPFVVKVNGNDDFTVLAVGTPQVSSAYNVGENVVDFNTGTTMQITLADGETIAPGFLDANADGSGGSTGSVIPYDSNNPADEIWYSGGPASDDSGSISEGDAPTGGLNTLTNLTRNYRFRINLSEATPGGSEETVTLSPIQDAYLQGSTGHNNSLIRIENGNRVGYLKFDLSGISGNITKAELKMTCTGDSGNGNMNVNLGTSNNWNESNLSNSNAPGSGVLLGNLNGNYSIGTTYTWSLDESSLSGGGDVSLVVSATGGNDAAFASKENSVIEPQLIITYNSSSILSRLPNSLGSSLKDVKLIPNPIASGTFKIQLPKDKSSKKVTIFESTGRLIYKAETIEKQLILNSNMFSSKGFYFINISGESGNRKIKAIVK